jgi:hypothetical protein
MNNADSIYGDAFTFIRATLARAGHIRTRPSTLDLLVANLVEPEDTSDRRAGTLPAEGWLMLDQPDPKSRFERPAGRCYGWHASLKANKAEYLVVPSGEGCPP